MFVGRNMTFLMNHQKKFMKMAFGGTVKYNGRSMRAAHAKINNGGPPTEEHFNAVAECLVGTLKDMGVGQSLIDEVVAIVLTVKDDVLCKEKVE